MIADVKAAGALGAKTARPCESCLRRRARWFCAADDAFLCHGCDTLVHSANQLASRHERVRLQTASSKKVTAQSQAWHSGFTRKARTPRQNKHLALQQRLKDQVFFNNTSILPLVPELGGEEPVDDETEEQLLLRVPVFDPFDAEPCTIYNQVKNDAANGEEDASNLDNFSGFLPSEMDLAEFAADVESLLGSGHDEDFVEVFDYKQEDGTDACAKSAMVKVKDEEFDADTVFHLESVFDMTSDEAFHWNIDSVLSPVAATQKEEEKVVVPVGASNSSMSNEGTKRDIFLRLNYEEVITAWASQGSPWTTGNPPKFNSDDFFPNCMGWSGADGDVRSLRGHLGGSGDREARVSRYREKRRTRLFAKKIRYEVRKLNAEKRPRMKGRFVKRTCFSS